MGNIKLYFVAVLIMASAAYALDIDLSITGVYSLHVTHFGYDDSERLFEIELLNNGSIPYTARAKLTVNSDPAFTAWTQETQMAPGDNKVFFLHWPAQEGDYEATLRIYYGDEIFEEKLDFAASTPETEDIFRIGNIRVFNNYMTFAVTSSEDTEAVIIPDKYPRGWIFTQSEIQLRKNLPARAFVTYTPTIWSPSDISLTVASKDGHYAATENLHMDREIGLEALLNNAIFSLARNLGGTILF